MGDALQREPLIEEAEVKRVDAITALATALGAAVVGDDGETCG